MLILGWGQYPMPGVSETWLNFVGLGTTKPTHSESHRVNLWKKVADISELSGLYSMPPKRAAVLLAIQQCCLKLRATLTTVPFIRVSLVNVVMALVNLMSSQMVRFKKDSGKPPIKWIRLSDVANAIELPKIKILKTLNPRTPALSAFNRWA